MTSKPICYIVTPVGMLGYGLDEELTAKELSKLVPTGIPTALILDSGSTDSGPGKLAFGSMTCPRLAYVKDLTKLLALVHKFRVPLIFSSAGGDGTDEHVKEMCNIIEEIAADETNKDYYFKTISIFSGIEKATVLSRLKEGRINGCGPCVPPLSEEDVESAQRIVAQVGPEPFVDAMEEDSDFNIIVGGRAYDPAPYVAYAVVQLKRQFPDLSSEEIQCRCGGFLHMGKIMECGGLCSVPKSFGALSAVYEDGTFDVWPLDPESRCTSVSVAAHTLYENTRPDILYGPGGALHLDGSRYEQLDDGRTVRVSGSIFRSSSEDGIPYQLKLEAARVAGYRTMFLGSIRDHILINQIDALLLRVKQYVHLHHSEVTEMWDLEFHVYGKGQSTPTRPGEIFLVAEALAPSQQLATSVASKARVAMIHGSYPGQKATSGNFGFGIGGLTEIELGQCAQFCIYHLMNLDLGEERLNKVNQVGKEKLIRSSVSVIGRGQPQVCDSEFIASAKALRDLLPNAPTETTNGQANTAKDESALVISPKTISDVSRVLRSKNAGPYEITIDVMFATEEIYRKIYNSDLLSVENVIKALGITREDIIWMGFFKPALAFKITIPRFRGGKRASAGGFMEDDVHGSQQHTGIASLALPDGLFI
ncbi:hypothetical protein PT974_01584 [Cladobotryum mycophilum]|uniref:Caib baif family enzyme n=1 Tax=Cladobotryum mycophilum TaxID=491253 RepID=A0ABR0T443_9HYPO